MRIHPLIAGPAASVMIASLIGVVAVKGWLPGGASSKQSDVRPADLGRKPVSPSSCALCGTVESIRTVEITVEIRDEAGGAGAAAGGAAGAGAGGQTDGESHGTAVTLLGGAGGAIAGNEIEKNMKKRYAYRVTVRMDDGSYRTVSLSSPPTLVVGDKVRMVEGRLVRT
jgi:outer membrane lipoprotein SlyB